MQVTIKDFETFMHVKLLALSDKPPRATLAIRRQGTKVYVGVSFCNPKDSFVKARGRIIAHGRMESLARDIPLRASEQAFILDIPPDMPKSELLNSLRSQFLDICKSGRNDMFFVPKWVSRMIKTEDETLQFYYDLFCKDEKIEPPKTVTV